MGLISWAERKIEMKIVAALIERVFKNWITTALGVLLGFAGVVSAVYNLIPSTAVWQGHNVGNTLLAAAGVAVALAGAIAKDKNIGINPPTLPTKVGMIVLMILAGSMLWPVSAQAQTVTTPTGVQNIYAAGASYSINASPSVAGTALYAHSLNSAGTYAFTVVDALPATIKPFTVTTNIGAGIAQKLFTLGKIPVYVPTAAGISWSGTNTGWQWSGGGLASIHVKGNYYLMPSVRFLKSSVSGGTGYQPILGLLVAWGK
jgi:hypothetical protein